MLKIYILNATRRWMTVSNGVMNLTKRRYEAEKFRANSKSMSDS